MTEIDWKEFEGKYLKIETGEQKTVVLTNWRRGEQKFGDEDPKKALVFDVVEVDGVVCTPSKEYSTSSLALIADFRKMIDGNVHTALRVVLKKGMDKRYTVIEVKA